MTRQICSVLIISTHLKSIYCCFDDLHRNSVLREILVIVAVAAGDSCYFRIVDRCHCAETDTIVDPRRN